METLPKRLQLKYNGGGMLPKGGYTASFGRALLETAETFKEVGRTTRRECAEAWRRSEVLYVNFCSDENRI